MQRPLFRPDTDGWSPEMWSLLNRTTQLTIIIGTSFVFLWGVQAIYQWLAGTPTNPLKWVSLIVFLVEPLLVAAGNVLWRKLWTRFPALNRIAFPNLHGTWKGTL